ncbi:hypothetical protein C8R45DRAFT_1163891, partial [Mycena sanguinolenta]
ILWALPTSHIISSFKTCPWTLTHVSCLWRNTALSNTSLWSLTPTDFSLQRQYPLETIRTQMERSVSFAIHFFGSQAQDSHPQIALFELLTEYSARWVELNVVMTSHLVPNMTAIRFNLLMLRRVMVRWNTVETLSPELDSVDFFGMAVSLVNIGVHTRHRFIRTQLPVFHKQLTRYDFDAPWEMHRKLLKVLPNLQEVRILVYFDEDWSALDETIELRYLRRLYVSDSISLDYLRTPAQKEIAILAWETDNRTAWTHLEPFLLRSSCSPHKLT